MNKEERLREYINKDYSYINYKTGVEEGTDFDKFCIQHCKDIEELLEENEKYKEVIDKIDKYINDYNVFEVFSFPLMKRWEEEQVKSSIDYEFKTSLIKDLKDILKEVE